MSDDFVSLEPSRSGYEGVNESDEKSSPAHEECKHKKHKKKLKFSNNSKCFIVFFTILMPANCLFFEVFYFHERLKDFDKFISLSTFLFLWSMAMVSYYKTITIKNNSRKIDHSTLLIKDGLDSAYVNTKICTKCPENSWKPPRSHHCRHCNSCTLRMDHHCPWAINCIGYRNHKSFYLFTIYMFGGAAHYCISSIAYFIYEANLGLLYFHDIWFFLYWTFTSLVLYPTTLGLLSLVIFHSLGAMNNVTTLESMAGTPFECPLIVNLDDGGKRGKDLNLYNMGLIVNYIRFLGNSLLWFWFPTETDDGADGISFIMNPPVLPGEIMKHRKIAVPNRSLNSIENGEAIKLLFDAADKKYAKCFLKLKEETIEYSRIAEEIKNNENSFA